MDQVQINKVNEVLMRNFHLLDCLQCGTQFRTWWGIKKLSDLSGIDEKTIHTNLSAIISRYYHMAI